VLEGAARNERAAGGANREERIIGTVQLIIALPDNQPHRADIAKMLVHRDARRQGVAAQLMAAVDQPRATKAGPCWCWTPSPAAMLNACTCGPAGKWQAWCPTTR
jgi:GNAT superfamily N-acetyltransferase